MARMESTKKIVTGLQRGMILGSDFTITVTNPSKFNHHVTHSIHQLIRISAILAQQEAKKETVSMERVMQLGLNLGRLQEMSANIGEINMWWYRFKPHVGNWKAMQAEATMMCMDMELPMPTEEFMNKP